MAQNISSERFRSGLIFCNAGTKSGYKAVNLVKNTISFFASSITSSKLFIIHTFVFSAFLFLSPVFSFRLRYTHVYIQMYPTPKRKLQKYTCVYQHIIIFSFSGSSAKRLTCIIVPDFYFWATILLLSFDKVPLLNMNYKEKGICTNQSTIRCFSIFIFIQSE